MRPTFIFFDQNVDEQAVVSEKCIYVNYLLYLCDIILEEMCVDDYQFRHFSAKREKICKRFIFKNEEGEERAFLINISQFQRNGELCLCQILIHLVKKGLQVKDHSFYMPQFNITIEAGDRCKIPFDLLTFKQVFFQMKYLQNQHKNEIYDAIYSNETNQYQPMDQNQLLADEYEQQCDECKNWIKAQKQKINKQKKQQQMAQQEKQSKTEKSAQELQNSSTNVKVKQIGNETNAKKHKQQEKIVQEALYVTKCWRLLHQNQHYSLKNAANMVGLSKKTLDDYFLVLRVAEYHGYNFESNLTKKIGHLRAFIRNQPVKVTGRLPKEIKSFNLVPNPDLTNFLPMKDQFQGQDNIQQDLNNGNQRNGSEQSPNDSEMVPE